MMQCSEKCLMLTDTYHHVSKFINSVTQIFNKASYVTVQPSTVLGKL